MRLSWRMLFTVVIAVTMVIGNPLKRIAIADFNAHELEAQTVLTNIFKKRGDDKTKYLERLLVRDKCAEKGLPGSSAYYYCTQSMPEVAEYITEQLYGTPASLIDKISYASKLNRKGSYKTYFATFYRMAKKMDGEDVYRLLLLLADSYREYGINSLPLEKADELTQKLVHSASIDPDSHETKLSYYNKMQYGNGIFTVLASMQGNTPGITIDDAQLIKVFISIDKLCGETTSQQLYTLVGNLFTGNDTTALQIIRDFRPEDKIQIPISSSWNPKPVDILGFTYVCTYCK